MANSITHSTLIDWVNEADTATIDGREISEKCRDYYDGNQWTQSEINKLRRQKQAATVINRVKPKIDGLMGLERQNRTTVKAYPRTPKHEKGAHAVTEAVRFVLDDNAYDQSRSSAWDNLLVEGTGGVEVLVKPKGSGFKIVINHIPWDRIIYDPHSRKKDFADSRYLGQVKWLDYDVAKEEFPDGSDVLEVMISGSQTYDDKPRWMDTNRHRVKVVELYYLDGGDYYYACFTRGGFLSGPKICPYKNEEGETEDPYCFGSLFVTREGERYGHVKQLLDVQDEINKRRSKALHLMSVRQTFATKGAVEDVNTARSELAKPDGHLEIAFGEHNKDFGILPTGDMAKAQFDLLAEAKMEIDSVSYNAAASGKDQRAISGVALRARQVAGQTEVAPMFDVLKNMDVRVYRKVWNRIKQYWKEETWLRVTDDEQNLNFVGLNAPITKGQKAIQDAQAQGLPPQQLQMLQAQIDQDPSANEVVDTQNDVTDLDVDIVMADAPDTVTSEIEDFQTLGEMVKSGFPIPPMAVIEASPLNNKDRILKMMRESPQLPPQVQEQMQGLQEQAKKLAEENQALKSDQSSEMAKIQAKAQSDQANLQLKASMQAQELELEKAKISAEIELERAKAEAQLQIEGIRLKAQKDLDESRLSMEQEHATKKMDMEVTQKRASDPAFAEAMDMPRTADLLEQVVKGLGDLGAALEKIATLQATSVEIGNRSLEFAQNTLAAVRAPATVRIGNVMRDMNGGVVGAEVSKTIN